MRCNPLLMEELGLPENRRERLVEIYSVLEEALENPQEGAVATVRDIEAQIQHLWGFPEDEKMWYYEFHIKGCTCPSLDNEDMRGTAMRYYAMNCPWHSGSMEKVEE